MSEQENDQLNPDMIELEIRVDARYAGKRIQGPCLVTREVTLTVPHIEAKYINLGKVMEGVIIQVVDQHTRKVQASIRQKEKEERERKEAAKDREKLRLWNNGQKAES
jgi:hypothetical protein